MDENIIIDEPKYTTMRVCRDDAKALNRILPSTKFENLAELIHSLTIFAVICKDYLSPEQILGLTETVTGE